MNCTTPEEMIITLISQNRGTKNFIQKSELIEIAIDNGLEVDNKMDKKDIAIALAEKIGYPELAKLASAGVSSLELQKKFGITNNEVKKMAKGGFITVVGTESFRMYGKTCHADLYSPYDYFKSEEDVINWLVEHPKGVRRKDEN